MPEIRSLARLSEVADSFDAIISDVWGVLHNGLVATPGAAEALAAVRATGKPVVLLTNAPRPPHSIAVQLLEMGITNAAYDRIVSSGGVTRDLIGALGAVRFYHIGPARDQSIHEGLACRKASLEEADFVLCTGLLDDETETAEDYRAQLTRAAERKLTLYCANPDLIVERGHRLIPCAGALGQLYEELGGETIWVGKPRPLVYDHAVAEIERLAGHAIPRPRILCLGDAFRTDIAGAVDNGFPVVFLAAGIHAAEIGLQAGRYDDAALHRLASASTKWPTMAMVGLTW